LDLIPNDANRLVNLADTNLKTYTNGSLRNKYSFSIIVPVYEEEKILGKHLIQFGNVLKKHYHFELIVSDGGSQDNTVEIARTYADKIVVHSESRRQTISEGRNMGAYQANSDILVFLNGDCIPADMSKFLLILKKFANSEDEYGKYGAMACYVTCFPDEMNNKDRIFYTLHNSYVRFLNKIGMGMGRGECQIVRKKYFDQVGGYNNSIVAGEDFDLFRRLTSVCKIKFETGIHIYESPRRFRKYGYIKTLLYWILNSITVMAFGKSVSKEWEAIR
jgi:glycosyltransferase involved in cell wall biosynthesis